MKGSDVDNTTLDFSVPVLLKMYEDFFVLFTVSSPLRPNCAGIYYIKTPMARGAKFVLGR